jgi:chaperonin GroES
VNIRPLADRVIVRREEEKQTTASGIYIPDSGKEKPNRGEVLAIGPGKASESGALVAMTVKAGDKVLFGQYAGQEITLEDGTKVLVMREDDILAIV